MKKQVEVIVADAAGNVTIFVNTPFKRSQYAKVASQLLDNENLGGEQVAFIKSSTEAKMEMCGLEFCGNASRAFGLMLAEQRGARGTAKVMVDVSGCEELLTVEADTISKRAKIKMPNPVESKTVDLSLLEFGQSRASLEDLKKVPAIDFGGILHIILKDVKATGENFRAIKDLIYQSYEAGDVPALGVMFYDTSSSKMTPVVYVKEVDSTYFEGSCGSGTTACAVAFSADREDGTYKDSFMQPAGVIDTVVEVRDGRVENVFIESRISYGDVITVEIEV